MKKAGWVWNRMIVAVAGNRKDHKEDFIAD